MNTLILTHKDMATLVATVGHHQLMDALIQELEHAFQTHDTKTNEIPARSGFLFPKPDYGVLEWMPSHRIQQDVTVKTVVFHPSNPSRYGIPTVMATIAKYDVPSGHLAALMDGVFPTALRTGAASAVASKHLARKGPLNLAMIGCGFQSVTQIHAISRVLEIEKVYAYDIIPERAKSLQERLAFLNIEITAADLATCEANADIICTATSAAIGDPPVIEAQHLSPWCHINAIGSDMPGKLELPRHILEQALVVPDFLEQARIEGECQRLEPSEIGPSLTEILHQPERLAQAKQGISVFDSTGFALEDQVVADLVYRLATEHGLGQKLQIELLDQDPFNPYAMGIPALAGSRA